MDLQCLPQLGSYPFKEPLVKACLLGCPLLDKGIAWHLGEMSPAYWKPAGKRRSGEARDGSSSCFRQATTSALSSSNLEQRGGFPAAWIGCGKSFSCLSIYANRLYAWQFCILALAALELVPAGSKFT